MHSSSCPDRFTSVSFFHYIIEKFNHTKIPPGTCGRLVFVNIPEGKGGCGNQLKSNIIMHPLAIKLTRLVT